MRRDGHSSMVKKKKFTLKQATKAQRGSNVYLYTFFNLGAIWGGWSTPRPSSFIPGNDPVPIIQEVGWAPASVRTGAENFAPTGFRSLDHSARSESLNRLSYRGPQHRGVNELNLFAQYMDSWRAAENSTGILNILAP